MKTIYKILFFFIISTAAFLAAALIMVRSNGSIFGDQSRYRKEVYENEIVESNGVSKILIDTLSTDVEFFKGDDDQINVVLEGEVINFGATEVNSDLDVIKDGEVVSIKARSKSFGIFLIYGNVDLKIYLPVDYHGDVSIESSSSDVTVNDLELNQLTVDTSSGDIDVSDVTVETFNFDSRSGDLDLNQFKFTNAVIETSSGDLDGEAIEGNITFDSLSGDFDVEVISQQFDINLDTSSGDIELDLLNNTEFTVDIKSISGDIDTSSNFEVTVQGSWSEHELTGKVGNGNSTIFIRTDSGNVEIK